MTFPDDEITPEEFATGRHAAAQQKYLGQPYHVHLRAVVDIIKAMGFPAPMEAAGWLHDVVEDTATSIHDVKRLFGDDVGRLVWAVSGMGTSRKVRVQDAYDKILVLRGSHPHLDATSLKLADRLANVRAGVAAGAPGPSFLKMYKREWPSLQEKLKGAGAPQLWDELRALMESIFV